MKKRTAGFLFASLLTISSVLSACTSDQTSSNETGGKAKAGGTLVVARLSDATTLDPHFITDIPSANVVYEKVYETLVVPDKNMEPQPLLATEWKQIDNVTWEFKLRDGVKFHDGAPFNADAVKTNFERILDPKTASPQAGKFEMIKEIKVVDDSTVQFILKYPYAPLLSILMSNEGSIISPKSIAENSDKIGQNPVGTGPYVFKSWKSGEEINIVKNNEYWGNKPKIDGVVFKVVPEDATRLAMIETGEAHVTDQVPVTEIERIEASDTMDLYRTDGLAVEYLSFNVKKKPFDDVRVRKAIAHAIEVDSIIKGVYNNVGTRANSTMSPKVFGYDANIKGYDYDINESKKLLKEAGIKDGFEFTLTTSDRKERINMAEVIQSQLKGIGIKVKIQVLEYGAYIGVIAKGEHQVSIGGWGNATGDGDYNQFNLFDSKSQGAAGNSSFYSNPEVDKLIETARKESDSEKRKELYSQAQKIESEEVPYVPIRNYEHLAVYGSTVKGLWLNPASYLMLDDVTVK
ncbi:glutathione ABC transporter substrate-binding protein [Bacillus sp. EAC]|uniref:glutathione ABC transporter substrate-binding protein n=1 Tax=Bacillus sp. EAC TaxID=1978338 RepID=UPI000B44D9C6|nr:glutathione ABC transporter substrate-binding protein [Bacillus sp. EAC]